MAGSNEDLFPMDLEQDPKENSRAVQKVVKSLKSMHASFIRNHMDKIGCPFSVQHLVCQKCPEDNPLLAAFDPERNRIVVCADKAAEANQKMLDIAIAHELIHAFDQCRAHVDWKNMEHYACSEIRATMLSRECLRKFQKNRRKDGQKMTGIWDCVAPRTLSSLKMMGMEESEAKKIINKVYSHCANDTSPYDLIPDQ